MISVKDLHKHFGEIKAVNGVTQTIEKGEKVVIIGPSGCGKSTFLRCLNLLETPTSGEIVFDGQPMYQSAADDPYTLRHGVPDLRKAIRCDVDALRHKMGMVFQQFNLFNNKTVLENITLAPIFIAKKKARKERRKQGKKERRERDRERSQGPSGTGTWLLDCTQLRTHHFLL